MKVVNSKEMFDLEKQALTSGISEKKMMKNAAKSIVKHLENSLEINLIAGISILVGKGNNGGDAIILGALLSRKYKVKIFEILKRSEDIAITLKREKPKDTNIELYEFNTNMINNNMKANSHSGTNAPTGTAPIITNTPAVNNNDASKFLILNAL